MKTWKKLILTVPIAAFVIAIIFDSFLYGKVPINLFDSTNFALMMSVFFCSLVSIVVGFSEFFLITKKRIFHSIVMAFVFIGTGIFTTTAFLIYAAADIWGRD